MAINFITGLPRQGKTLFTFVQVLERAKKEGRSVYYCNIPEVTLPGWIEIKHPDEWMQCPNDSIIVVDELQDFWGAAPSGARVPQPILELSKHGHRGIDFYFITQDPTLVHATPRKLCQTHWHVVRAFGSENAVAHKFNRMQTDPERVKAKSEKFPWRYPREAFGKRDKAGQWITKPWYKSADVHNVKREIPLKVWAIPGGVVLAGLAVWAGVHLFSGVLDRAGSASGQIPGAAAVSSVQARPVASSSASASGHSLGVAEYLEQRRPRVPGFPHTAPVYDQVTQPVEAPFPAACVNMGERCECYTQQATLMRVAPEVCIQIVHRGYFVDWQRRQEPVQPRREEPVRTAAVAAPAQPPVVINMPAQVQQPPQSGYEAALAARNAQVRSNLVR